MKHRRLAGELSIYNMDESFTPVIFATLTETNGTGLPKLLDGVSKFVRDVSFHTKAHIKPFIGYEDGANSHAHLVLSVPDDELEDTRVKLAKFKAWKSWRFRTLDFQAFEQGHDTFGYVLKKHTPLLPKVVCPKRYASCRNGQCSHIHHDEE